MTRVPAILLVLLAAGAASAQQGQRQPSVTTGALVAERMCSYCHRIAPDRQSEVEAGAPGFVDIANLPGRDAEYLRRFTGETHIVTSAGTPPVPMSTAVLTPQSREDVIAYILSLKAR